MKYLVVDQDTHQPVKMGEDGMLMVRGPSVFRGYLNSDADPFVTIGAHKYYETGDIVSELATLHPGTRNDLKFKDRGGRMIKVAGEKVFKGVLEQAFRPFFEERRPHNEDGTLYAGDLFVIESKAEDDSPLILFSMVPVTLDEILIHARELGLPGTARISEVRIVPEIPQLGVGKTDYKFFQNQLSSDAKLSSSASAQ
jgi:non-ribosomal peptide synthetase component E (peptide arylation enzyme)